MDALLLGKGEKFLDMLYQVFEEMGGKDLISEQMLKAGNDGDAFKRQLITALLQLNKKQFDVWIARLRIQADKDSDKSALNGGVRQAPNVFIIKGLHDVGEVIDITGQVQEIVDGPKKLQLKGLEE